MADKSILDLTEATSLADAMYSIIEDGISSKKFKLKTLEDFLIANLFLNYYQTMRSAANIQLTDLLSISPAGDNPTQKTTLENIISAINRLNTFDKFTAKNTPVEADTILISDSAAQSSTKKTTLTAIRQFLTNTDVMKRDLSNSVHSSLSSWLNAAPANMPYISEMGGYHSKISNGLSQHLYQFGIISPASNTGTVNYYMPKTDAQTVLLFGSIWGNGTASEYLMLRPNNNTSFYFSVYSQYTFFWLSIFTA